MLIRQTPRLVVALAVLAGLATGSSATAQNLCAAPGDVCSGQVQVSCLGALGAGSLAVDAAGGSCKQQLASYTSCLADAIEQCGRLAGGDQRLGERLALGDVEGVPVLTGSVWHGVYDKDVRAMVDMLDGLRNQIVYFDLTLFMNLDGWRNSERTFEETERCYADGVLPRPEDIMDSEEIILLPDAMTDGACADLADPRQAVVFRFKGDESDYAFDVVGCGTGCLFRNYSGLFRVELPQDNRANYLNDLDMYFERAVELQAIGGEVVLQNRAARKVEEMQEQLR